MVDTFRGLLRRNLTNVTGTVPVSNGGTGSTTLTLNYVLLGNGSSPVQKIAPGTSGNVLVSNGTTWASGLLALSAVSGTLAVGNGGTGAATLTANHVLLGNGTSALQTVAPSTAGNVLTSDGATWASTVPAVTPTNTVTLSNKTYISASTSTVTAAGTTTLTSSSAPVQIFTGSNVQTVLLPSTGVVAGQEWRIINQSSTVVSVKSSDNALVLDIRNLRHAIFRANIDNPSSSADWKAESPSTTNTAGTTVERTTQGWAVATAFQAASTSTASSAGTLTMSASSNGVQVITGTTTHTVKLPSSSIAVGMVYTIINQSSGTVTVQSSGANTISTVAAGSGTMFMALQAVPTAAAHWRAI